MQVAYNSIYSISLHCVHTVNVLTSRIQCKLLYYTYYTGDSGLVEITECSESGLNFTLNKTLNISSGYTFLAVCKDNDGTCVSENLSGTDDILICSAYSWLLQVDHKSSLPLGVEPTVGSTFPISVGPSCTLSELSPNGTGLCTLLISITNIARETSGIVFSDSCTLPTSPPVVSSTAGKWFVDKHHLKCITLRPNWCNAAINTTWQPIHAMEWRGILTHISQVYMLDLYICIYIHERKLQRVKTILGTSRSRMIIAGSTRARSDFALVQAAIGCCTLLLLMPKMVLAAWAGGVFLPSISANTSPAFAVGITCNLQWWCYSCTN